MAEPTTWAFVCVKEQKEVNARVKRLDNGLVEYACPDCGGKTETKYYLVRSPSERYTLTHQQVYPEIYGGPGMYAGGAE